MSSSTSANTSTPEPQPEKKPTVLLCIGMAGSGKTTFMQVFL
jgi:signal recognition particle GTPase